MRTYISPAMQKAAPDLCKQTDKLREDRKRSVERRCYLHSIGMEEDAAAMQEHVEEIDAAVSVLHAQAKEQLIAGVAKDLSQGAASLRCAASDSATLSNSLEQENKRHSDAVAKIVHLQKSVGSKFSDAVNTMEAAAGTLTDGGEEQATEPGTAVAGAGSSTDRACPKCFKIFKGDKGLATHLRSCNAQIDAEQAPSAEAPAEVNSTDKEQVPDGESAPCPCGYCTGRRV